MHRVMIVDDEIAVREKLPSIIDFNAYGFEVSGTARNGKEAMEKLPLCKPDLIFLDVRMPIMDGISFLSEIRKTEFKDVNIIILSGYSDFEYAKKAVEYGVKAYLTKPIDEDEAGIYLKAIGTALDDKERRLATDEYKEILNDLKKIYNTGSTANNLDVYSIIHIVLVSMKSEYENIHPFEIINTCISDRLGISAANNEILFRSRGSVYSYLVPKDVLKEDFAVEIREDLKKSKLNCAVLIDRDIFRDIFDNKLLFKQIFSERLHSMLTEVFYNPEIKYLEHKQSENEVNIGVYEAEDRFISRLKQSFSDLNSELIEDEFKIFCDKVKEFHLDMVYIQRINYRVYYIMLDIIKSVNHTGNEAILSPPEWRDYATFISFEKWKLTQRQQINEVLLFVEQSRTLARMGVCGDVLEYVHLHFTEHITIKDVADTFHINSAYLGRIFQKATGINFKKYINNLRIQEAKRLLLQTDKLIYEIANDSGFAESSYFISKFTSEAGISPSDFRKQ